MKKIIITILLSIITLAFCIGMVFLMQFMEMFLTDMKLVSLMKTICLMGIISGIVLSVFGILDYWGKGFSCFTRDG